jgi:hypothetical protein
VLANGAPANAIGVLALGVAAMPSPGLPVLNARLFVDPFAGTFLTLPAASDASGATRTPLALPASLPLPAGIYLQGLWATAPSCSTGGPLAASHALGF